jgi:hypothetical protein
LAKQALHDHVQAHHDGPPPSPDFAKGFVAGFSRYLEKGGTGNPPPVPPRCYWRVDQRTGAGRQGAEDWFDGFRMGSATAMVSGLRLVNMVPTSVPPPRTAQGWAEEFPSEGNSAPAGPPVLPSPREISPATQDAASPSER